MVAGDESWFYHKQIGRKSSNAAWVAKGDPPPTVVGPNKFAPRTLFSIFFTSNGLVIIHRIERGQNIDHGYYIDNCLQPLVNEIKRQRPSLGTRAVKLLHDNGRPHVHKAVCNYLEPEYITIIPHPSNSPDLAPGDFWLFDLIKQNIDGQKDVEPLHDAITTFTYSLDQEEYKKTFDK